jgi:type II secretory pathway pseudopilin PulG
VILLVGTLVAVVVAHTMMASAQVRLTDAQGQLAAEQAVHQQLELDVAGLESPQRIAKDAASLQLSLQGNVAQVPYVPLDVALPAPTVTAAPPPPPPAATQTQTTQTAGSSASGSASATSASTPSTTTGATTPTTTGTGTTSTSGTATGQ